jgi:hypothetical protein
MGRPRARPALKRIYKPQWGPTDISILSKTRYGRNFSRGQAVIWRMREFSAVSQTKQASRRKQRRRKAIPVLGAAGLSLSLVNGAWAAIAADMPARNTGVSHEITLGEEEISDVSLAAFYVFDKENPRTFRRGVQLAMGGGGGAFGGCWTGTNFNDSPGPPHSSKSAHKYTHATKPAPARKNRRRTTQQR